MNLKHIYIFLFIIAAVFTGCSTDNTEEIQKQDSYQYFVQVLEQNKTNRDGLITRLGYGDSEYASTAKLLVKNNTIRTIAIEYNTKAPNGSNIVASGLLSFPDDGVFRGVVVGEHYTVGSNAECPTSVMATVETALALYGYVVIAPDYLGFGSTVSEPQAYLNVQSAGQVSIDMVFAVREYMKALNMPIDDLNTYVVGYSQGGQVSIAFTKMAEEKYSDKITIKKVMAGGGPYDPLATITGVVEKKYTGIPCSIPLSVIGLNYGDNLKINFNNIFKEPLLSNYKEWYIDGKKYTTGQLNAKLGSNDITAFMNDAMFTEARNPDFNKLFDAAENNDLTKFVPKAKVILVHSQDDEYVPYSNAVNAEKAWKAGGANVELITTTGSHPKTGAIFYLKVLNELK